MADLLAPFLPFYTKILGRKEECQKGAQIAVSGPNGQKIGDFNGILEDGQGQKQKFFGQGHHDG
jgi:hypothetical protein